MAKDIQLKRGQQDLFSDQDASWIALDIPEVKPPIYAKAFILFLSSFLAVGVIYSAVTEVPVVVESPGKLITEKPAIPVRAPSGFMTESILVKENQMVKAGAPLIASQDNLKVEELQLAKDFDRELENFLSKSSIGNCNGCEMFLVKAFQISQKLDPNGKVSSAIKPMAEMSRAFLETFQKFKQVEKNLLPMKNKLLALSAQAKRGRAPASVKADGEFKQLQQKYSEQILPYAQTLQKLRENMKLNSKEFAKALDAAAKQSGVAAPIDGKVINIRARGKGEVISSGQPVMEIIPADTQLMVQLFVTNRDIGAIKPGDSVDVSVDAFPEMDYGTLKGKVKEILPGDVSEDGSHQERGFRVNVVLDSQEIKAGNDIHSLLPGMTVRARSKKRQETLLKTFYRSIFKIREEVKVRG